MSVFAGKTMEDIDGNTVHLNQLARKVTLVVNVACFCTFTKQYPGLQELQVLSLFAIGLHKHLS